MARLREFDVEEALDSMMDVFWRNGYAGTSMQDIENATGLNKQSLYRLYPDKRAMYLAALQHFEATEMAATADVLAQEGTAKEKFERLFDELLRDATAKGGRRGCFLCNASADQAQLDRPTQKFVSSAMARMKAVFVEALESDAHRKKSSQALEEQALSIMAGYFGLRIMTRAHAPLKTLTTAASALLKKI